MTTFTPWNANDFDWTAEFFAEPAVRYELGGGELPRTARELMLWLEESLQFAEVTPLALVIRTDPGAPIGLALVDELDWHNRSARLRMALKPDASERIDHMVMTLKTLTTFAFHSLNYARLWMTTGDDLHDHHDALSACLFQPEFRRRRAWLVNGIFHDCLGWSLLRAEWRPNLS